ncbi:unnamed protein product [Rhizophagus irregularis]|nr:unnamed protein product [Rhizophagus irregularis]
MSALATESNFSYGRDDLSASVKVHDTVNRLINRKNDKRVKGLGKLSPVFGARLSDLLSTALSLGAWPPAKNELTDKTNSVNISDNIITTNTNIFMPSNNNNLNNIDNSITNTEYLNSSSATGEFITNITGKERSKKKKNKLEKVIEENNKNNQKVIQKLENIEKLVKGLQKSEVDIFKIKYSEWEKIQMSTGLKFEAIDLKLKQETKNNAFQWDDSTEREQKDRYLPHLRKLLQISKYRKLEIYDTTNNNNFLSMRDDTLPIKLIGTTDAAVVNRFSISSRIPQHHIRILFELKKSISDGNL